MSKFVIAGLIWRCINYPQYSPAPSDFSIVERKGQGKNSRKLNKIENFVYQKITKLSSKYGIANSLTEEQIEDTSYDFMEALFDQDGVFLRNVKAKYYKSDRVTASFANNNSFISPNQSEIQKFIKQEEEKVAKINEASWTEFENRYLNTCILGLLEKNADPVTKEKLVFRRELIRALKKYTLLENEFEKLYYGPNKAGFARFANTTLLGNSLIPVKYASEEEYEKRRFIRIMPKEDNGRAQNKNLKENVIDLLNIQPQEYYFEDVLIGKYLYQPQNIISYDALTNIIADVDSDLPDSNNSSIDSIEDAITEEVEGRILDIELNDLSESKKKKQTEILLAGLGEYYLNFPELFTGKIQIKPEHYAMLFPEDTKSKDKTNKIQNFLNKILLGKLSFVEPIKRETTNNRMTAFRKERDDLVSNMISETSLSALDINKLILRDLFDFYKKVIGE